MDYNTQNKINYLLDEVKLLRGATDGQWIVILIMAVMMIGMNLR